MSPPTWTTSRGRLVTRAWTTGRGRLVILAAALVAVVGVFVAVLPASAATQLSDDFSDGNADGWSKSGGAWAVVNDGTPAIRQSKLDSELARAFAGSNSWTNYTLQARVKPLAFDGADRYVGIGARSSSATTFYRLALLNNNRAELQAVNGGRVTVLGGVSYTVSTGTWYTLRVAVSGSSIQGYVDGSQVASATNTTIGKGRVSLQTFHATATFDDVTVTDSASPAPSASTTSNPPATTTPSTSAPATTSPPATTNPPTPTNTNPPASSTGLVGWATQGGGTTGGTGGPTVTVTSLAALTSAAAAGTAQTIRVDGNFTCSADVKVTSNKTILGVGAGSGLTGCGLSIKGVSNVIVRNMRISHVKAGNGNGDAIHIDNATRLWIDHNELFSDTTSGTDYYDGLLDITHAADYITVSWNYLHDHIKCSLIGHSDSNASEDTGHLRVTYHHNRFDGCDQRNPRVRFGNPVHIYNNYFNNIGLYGIASTENGGVLVEGNYFENVGDPFHQGQADSGPGGVVARDNVMVNSGAGQTGGSVASIPYAYTVDTPSTVKAAVIAGAGTGKITT